MVTAAERERSGTLSIPGIASGALEASQEFRRFEVTNDWIYDPGGASSYSFGAAVSASRAEYEYAREVTFSPGIAAAFERSPTDAVALAASPDVVYASIYAAYRRQWARFESEIGVRLDAQDYEGLGEHAQVSPRLNLRYDFSDRTRMYTSIGRFTQAQHVEEWRIEEGQVRSDPAQTSIHSILGVTHETEADVEWSLEAYVKRWTRVAPYFDNLLNPLSLLPELGPDRVKIAPRESEASGLELNVRAPLGENWNGWGSFSWSRVADEFDQGDVLRSWDQSVSANAGITWRKSRLSISALGGWHRGWPRTPFELTTPVGDAPGTLVLDHRNGDRWPDYYTLDLRGSWVWPLRSGELTTTLELTNSTNRSNACCATLEGSVPGEPLRVGTDSWLPLVANLGFVYRWRRE